MILMLNNYYLVLPDPVKDKTDGGVILPDSAQQPPLRGTIIAGEQHLGKKVYWPSYAGIDFKFKDTDYKVLAGKDLIGVETEGETNE